MAVTEAGYFIGVGSNESPERNIPLALEALVERFGCLHSSSIYLTEPLAVDGDGLFRNLVLYLPTTLSSEELKAFCNGIETRLGRDRNHPQRKFIARPVDLDILYFNDGAEASLTPERIATEPYFLVAVPELLNYLAGTMGFAVAGSTEAIRLHGHEIGNKPFTLTYDHGGRVRMAERMERG